MVLLGDLADIVSGQNVARLSAADQDRKYTNADFERDFYRMKLATLTNPIIYRQPGSSESMAAAIISDDNRGKFISQVFAILDIDTKRLHPAYLCYLLNESDDISRQSRILLQGSVIVRLSAQQLKQIEIPLMAMADQERLGQMYVTALYQQYLEREKTELKFQALRGLLHDWEKSKRGEISNEQ